MAFVDGIRYQFRGLAMGLKTPSLLMLGMARLVLILLLTLVAVGLILAKYQEISALVWSRPESAWLIWLWYLMSWLLALLLAGICTVAAFLVAQLLFSVVLMDYMSRITERKHRGKEAAPPSMAWHTYCFYLIKQEVPRAALPIVLALGLMVFGWLTPLSPVLTLVSPMITVVFLAWDNTDLVPARRLVAFGSRFRFLRRNLGFHLGFGLGFLVPGLNLLLLSFAPVGATLYYLERGESEDP